MRPPGPTRAVGSCTVVRGRESRAASCAASITSDVVSTSAPQTTWRLLIQRIAAAQDRQRAERHLHDDERQQQRRRPRQLAAARGDATRT